MNVENKYLATLSLAMCTLTAPLSVAAETYTRDNPNLIQCDTCYSVADFERKAKTQAQSNNADYHLVYNMNTEVVETVFTFEIYEPELGISMSNARVVSTKVLHAQQFAEYVDYKKYGVEKKPVTGTVGPLEGGYGGMAEFYYSEARASVIKSAAFSPFMPILVKITFKNGDEISVLIPNAASGAIFLIYAKDKDGNDISSRASNSGGGSGGGAGGGGSSGSITVTIPGGNSGGGTLMCSPRNGGLEVNCKWV